VLRSFAHHDRRVRKKQGAQLVSQYRTPVGNLSSATTDSTSASAPQPPRRYNNGVFRHFRPEQCSRPSHVRPCHVHARDADVKDRTEWAGRQGREQGATFSQLLIGTAPGRHDRVLLDVIDPPDASHPFRRARQAAPLVPMRHFLNHTLNLGTWEQRQNISLL